jgi:trigger factor
MEFQVDPLGPCRKKVAVKIPAEAVGEAYDKKYREINEQVPLPGFRLGHAPRRLLEKRFGSKLGDEIKQDLVKEAIEKLIEEKRVEPLAPPEVDLGALSIAPDQGLEFEFEVVTRPEFETPTWKGREVRVAPIEATEKEIDAFVDTLRRSDSRLAEVPDGVAGEGDILVVDWEAKDGESVEDRDDNAFYRFGKGVLAGFVVGDLDEQLRGQKAGATARARVEVAADDPREELRGRTLDLVVTLKGVRRYELPPVDTAFLEKHDYDDLEELRDDMRKRILRAKGRGRDFEAERKLVEQLLDGIAISLPDEFIEQELEGWAQRKRVSLQVEGAPEEEIDRQVAAALEDRRAAIERDMRRYFLLERIAQEEAIEVTEAELVTAIEEIAQAYGHPVEQVMAAFRDPARLAELRSEIRHRKARERIRSHASVVEDPALAEAAADAATAEGGQRTKA